VLVWPVVVAATVPAVLVAAVPVLVALPVTWADLGRGQWFLFQIG
jgi:hypothetical protein